MLSKKCLSREQGQKVPGQSSSRLQGKTQKCCKAPLSVFVWLSSRMLLSRLLVSPERTPQHFKKGTGVSQAVSDLTIGNWLLVTVGHLLLYKIMCYIFSRYYNEDKWQNITAVTEFSLHWRCECEVKKSIKQNICQKLYKYIKILLLFMINCVEIC